jgi:hypothetical protein
MVEHHYFQDKTRAHSVQPPHNALREQYVRQLHTQMPRASADETGAAHLPRAAVDPDSLVGQQPWKASAKLRNDTGHGRAACAVLAAQVFGRHDIELVSQLDRLARRRGYHQVNLSESGPLPKLLPGSLVIATNGWQPGQSHVGIVDHSGQIVNNSINNKGEYAGVAQSWEEFVALHVRGRRRVYALVPPD